MSDQEEFKGFQTGSDAGSSEYATGQAPVENDPWADADTAASPAQNAAPDLDQSLPSLSGNTSQKLNKKGLMFLGVVAVVGFSAAAVAYKKLVASSETADKVVKEEVVDVPNRPEPPRLPPIENQAAAMPQELPQLPDMTSSMPVGEIPMASGMPAVNGLPTVPGVSQMMGQPGGEKTLTLAERRAMQSGSVYGSNSGEGGLGGGSVPANYQAGGSGAGGLFGGGGDSGGVASAKPAVATGAVRTIRNPDTLLLRGTYIRCALETKLVSDVAGYTSCVVTDPVYSMNGRKLLIERGSRVSGIYNDGDMGNGVYDRAAVLWNRVVTPSGRDIQLDSPGIDMLGGAGHPGQLNEHWGPRLGAAILVSMVADVFNYAGVKWGPTVTTTTKNSDGSITTSEDTFDSKTADVIAKMPDQILAKTMNRKATVTINQGTILNIYTARDIDFSSVIN